VKEADHLAKSRRAIASARLLLSDGDTDGACNRAYYATFDAAKAALTLVAPDLEAASIKTHRGLIGAFGQHLVKPGRARAELGRIINQVERIRLLADYTGEPIEHAKAARVVEQASEFVDQMAQLCARIRAR
jgi:uncharacterized protein (UPF0332 family)